ncbi:hypothetical protein BTVI_15895 [Pitangus sulphuratus]|nr:hypothetical protein BTVI_15895 [Pitangus sulphuratus]
MVSAWPYLALNGSYERSGDLGCLSHSILKGIEFKRRKGASKTSTLDMRADFKLLVIDPEIVQHPLLQLDPYKSMGPHGIHPRILKELADVITKPLSMIFERSWEYREVSADWKLLNIVSVVKKGKKEYPRNYRLVSLTSVTGKVMEKIILRSIEKYLKDNTFISHSQHVFRRAKSCLSNLL